MKRKLLCLCLILGILLSFAMTVSAKSFDDTEGHWAEEAIDEWSDNGILNGIGNNKFNPDGYMTRAEAAAVFSRLLALSERANISDFKDIDSDAWYAESLEKCVAAGILNGDGSNMNPNGYITREMFFTMFGRAFSIQPESTLTKEFSDADEISSWAQGYTYAFINQGYVNGVTKDAVAPKQNIDRASVITLLDRIIVNYAVQDNDVLQSTDQGISLVIANNCTVADGFSGTVVISGDDTKISFNGASVNTKIIVKADNVVIADVPEGITVSVVKGAENVEVNGKQVENDTTFTATVEKVEEKKPTVVGGGGHSHRYTGNETTKATCTEDGVMTYTCRCGRSYTEAIPKLSENDEHTPAESVKENETETTYDEVVYCSVCTVEISRTQKSNVSCTEHIPGTPVKENEVAGNCQTPATYDEVVYCSVCGTYEISRTSKTGELGDHTPGTPVKENEVAGNCQTPATYDEVVYCSVCGTHEISRTQKTGELGDHVPGTPVKENEVAGNCQTLATYDEVVYCSVCETHEISRTSKTGELGDHTPGTPVKENEVAGNCQTPATYDEVVYCSVCGTHEISRTSKTGELGNHIPDEAVKENIIASSCDSAETYDEVIYCSICEDELSREEKATDVIGHTPGTPVKENEVAGNCQTPATYDEVVYCSVCGTHEISRTQKTGALGNHTPGTPVKENEVAGNCQTPATYDEVVYCSVCGTHEISRTSKTGELGDHTSGTPVRENEVAGNCQTPATYNEVVYCSVCGTHEISRTQKTGALGNHTPGTPVKENEVAGNCQTPATYDEVVYCSVCGTHEISRTQKTGELGDHNFVGGSCEYCEELDPNFNPESPEASEGLEYDSNGDGTCYLIGIGDCEDTDIVIPETSPDGDTVFAIDRNAFADEAITSITIPTTIEEIGRNAFNGCDSLTDVYYLGTEAEWEALCEEIGTGNNALLNANIHFAQESVTYDGPTIVVESVEANAGDTVEVDVEFANNPGIFVARFTIEYDENALELDSVSLKDTFGGQFTAPEVLTSPVTIPWEESQLADNTNSGSMLTLKFKVKDSATSGTHGINITYVKGDICNVNEEDVDFTIINGSVTIE